MVSRAESLRWERERAARNSYFPRSNGPSKADLQRELAEAVRNTAAQQVEERDQ